MASVLPQLAHMVIKPTYPGYGGFDAALCQKLNQAQRDEWVGRITREPNRYSLQAYTPLSQMPTWKNKQEGVVPRSVMLRVFALRQSHGDGPDAWRVLPGGLARIAAPDADIASMQRGGSSADVWVQTHAEVDQTTLLHKGSSTPHSSRQRRVTSRAAENLYWLGRYTERAENSARLARHVIEASVMVQRGAMPARMMPLLDALARRHGLVGAQAPDAAEDPRAFVRALLAALLFALYARGYRMQDNYRG